MAENLRFVETLDHSNFDKGIAESTAAVRKLAEDAELANKGIKGMFDTPAMKEAAANFQGVEKAVQRFTQAMSRDLPMKQELRQTQQAATELEQIWRNLSDAEKQSAAGQELRSKIDMLIQRGGQLKDVMADVQRSMKFQSSDTAALTATVQGIQALTAAAQVAAGAMSLLGMEQEDAMKVQKNLMAVLSIANGLQTIQNLLQKESALMMGLSAVRTSALNAVTAVKVAMAKADTVATKGAAAAQALWNTAIAANPIGVLITVVAAATAAIIAFSQRVTESAKTVAQLSEANKTQAATLADNIAKLELLRNQWNTLTSDKEKEQWVRDNAEAFKSLGFEVNNTTDAENILVKNTSNVIAAMKLRAEAAAVLAVAQQKLQEAYQKREDAVHRRANPNAVDVARSFIPGQNFANYGQIASNAADQLENEAANLEESAHDLIRGAADLTIQAANLEKSVGVSVRSTANRVGGGKSTAKSTAEELIEGSFAWFNAEEQRWLALADKQTDYFSRQAMLQKAAAVAAERNLVFGDLRTGAVSIDPVRLADQINSTLPKLSSKIKPMVIPVTFEDPVAAAKAKSDELLKNTEGLRTAATAAASAFRNMGSAIGGEAGKVVNVAAMMAQAIATMIQGYATATAQAGTTLGPWGWLAFGLTGLAQLAAMVATVKGFAQGGIVGGTSYTGDRQFIRVNSGEMILNGQQQARLFSMINNGGGGGEVTFKIAGQQLVGVLNNYNSKMGKVR